MQMFSYDCVEEPNVPLMDSNINIKLYVRTLAVL